MSDPLEFTGERFTPECQREIWYEHYHRYALATKWCTDSRTLDAACGEGFGAALLATTATTVEAVDISQQAVDHASKKYAHIPGLGFHQADCTQLPFADNEFDRVVSFETLEHLTQQDQLLTEFRRVLKTDGLLILSSPDKAVYSDQHNEVNEFHLKELYREEFESLIQRHFPAWRLLGQKLMFHSAIWSLEAVEQVVIEQFSSDKLTSPAGIVQSPMYFIALCASEQHMLPETRDQLWLFDDEKESVYQHYYGEIRKNMAAGGRIAALEKEIEGLNQHADPPDSGRVSWWRRLFG